jgi:hypothetical protein
VGVAWRLVVHGIAGVVGDLLGQPLVERLVVLRLDPLVGRVDDLVAVVVADVVAV